MNGRSDAYKRFQDSKVATYERWHDGVGYDLEALAEMTDEERKSVEGDLIADTSGWRDVEALAALGTERARVHIRKCLKSGPSEVRMAAARALENEPASGNAREDAIVYALDTAEPMNGLSDAIDAAAECDTPRMRDALFRMALSPVPERAVNAAALLFYLHGKTQSPFDWSRRPFFLRFGEGPEERRRAFTEMCKEFGTDPAKYLTR